MSAQTNLLQGTLDLLILNTLALQKLHGLGIARRIEQVTNGTFQVKPGSLFPALHRMEEAGWVSSTWGESAAREVLRVHENRQAAPQAGSRHLAPDCCSDDERSGSHLGQHQR